MRIHRFFVFVLWTGIAIAGVLVWLKFFAEITKAEEKPVNIKPVRPWTVPLEMLCRGRQKVYLDFMPGGYIKGPIEIWCMGDERPLLRIKPGECFRVNGSKPELVRCADG